MTWKPTHRLTFNPANGGSLRQWMVMVCKDPYSQEYLVGLTEEDWQKQRVPTWRFNKADGSWWWMGQPKPLWKSGTVSAQELDETAPKPSTLRFARNSGRGTTDPSTGAPLRH